jgi:predicted Zn-dependent protease
MQIRPKTIRRLATLFCIALLVIAALTTWLLLSQRRIRGQIAQQRVAAIAAYDARDYSNAVALFSDYLTRSHAQDTDAEAVFDYAKSRLETPLEGNRQVYEAIGLFERYLQLDPSDSRDASHALLTLYTQARYNKEGHTLAERLLAGNPKDIAALHALVQTLRGDQNFAAALQACERVNAIDPDNLEWQVADLDLMGKSGAPAAQVLDHAKQLHEAHPDQSTFAALWAIALLNAHDEANARIALQQAAKLPPGKPENVLQIVRLLDMTQSFDLSDDLLNRATAGDPNSPRLMRLVVQRTWERSGPQGVIDRFKNLNATTADSSVLGYAAFSDFQTNHAAEGQSLLKALAARNDDTAKSWTILLQTSYGKDHAAPALAIKQYGQAALRDPSNALVFLLLGQTYAAIGETEAAVRQWTAATELSPSWAVPYGLISRTQSATGNYADALRNAEAARQRAPGSLLAETTYAVAWYGLSTRNESTNDPKDAKALSQLLETIQTTWPDEPTTLPLYVADLARNGNADRAKSVIATAIAGNRTSLPTLLQLAAVSRQQKLDQESAILDAAEKTFGSQPAIASARATAQIPAQAMASFDAAAASHAGDVAWMLTGARLADSVGDRSALARWITLGDAQPTNLSVQSAILQSPARRLDTAFWRRTIDRLKTIDGADGQLVQLEDARVKLAGPMTDTDAATLAASLQKLTSLMPNDPAAHQLLAQVYLKMASADHLSRAANEMQRAHDLRPADFETTAALAQILIAQGQSARAAALVDVLARDNNLAARQKLWVAQINGQLGHPDAGIALLTDQPSTPQRDSLLARLNQQAGKSDQAGDLYRKLLDESDSPADALTGGAEFFARAGNAEVANQFVSRIEKLPLQPGAAAIMQARVDQLLGEPQDATAVLASAVRTTPKVDQLWQELAGLQLLNGRIDDAQKTVADGLQANPKSDSLNAMQSQLALVTKLAPDEIMPLLDVICHQPLLPALDQTLKILADKSAPDITLAALRELSDQHPDFIPLQELLATRYANAGRLKDAAEMASRSANSAVNDPAPLRLLCAIQTAAGDWIGVHQSAQRWRAMTPNNTFDPDMALARGYLSQSRPDADAAVRQLAPYVTDSTAAKQRDQALPLFMSALISAGKTADAETLLKPRLNEAHWRMVWLELASSVQKDRAAALAWMQTIAPLIPDDSTDEKLALADAWERIGSRFDSADAHAAAMRILKPIVTDAKVPAGAWATWASVNQSAGDLPEAERGWRQFLAGRPNEPSAKNNLAYILLLEGGSAHLAEAETLCRDAIARQPGISGFYDTLARVQLAKGKSADAATNFRAALSRDPNNVEAMIGLADLLQSGAQNRDELKSLMIRIDAGLRNGTPLTPPIRQQLDRVKTALTSSI